MKRKRWRVKTKYRPIEVIREKRWESKEALEAAIRAFLDGKPGADQLDIADHCGIDLRSACEALDRLLAAGKIRVVS
jgi:hypothetical protein